MKSCLLVFALLIVSCMSSEEILDQYQISTDDRLLFVRGPNIEKVKILLKGDMEFKLIGASPDLRIFDVDPRLFTDDGKFHVNLQLGNMTKGYWVVMKDGRFANSSPRSTQPYCLFTEGRNLSIRADSTFDMSVSIVGRPEWNLDLKLIKGEISSYRIDDALFVNYGSYRVDIDHGHHTEQWQIYVWDDVFAQQPQYLFGGKK